MHLPIACSLDASGMRERSAEWSRLLATHLLARERIPGGIRIRVASAAAGELARLVDLERECCAWIEFRFPDPATVEMTASAGGEQALAGMFAAQRPRRLIR
jgi:hypothetical protein